MHISIFCERQREAIALKKNRRRQREKTSSTKWKIIIPSVLVVISAVIVGVLLQTDQPDQTDQINQFISPQDAFTLIQENQHNPDFAIIDDREPSAFNSGRIANATSAAWGPDFGAWAGDLDKDKTYLVYCSSGCGGTLRAMKELGFREVYEIAGGFNAWRAEGLPIES
jgi:rhodanese-related sulfurtransferase